MGSVNPVFLLPEALAERAEAIADGLAASVTLGVGQFCTNAGVVIGVAGEPFDRFAQRVEALIRTALPGTMLYPARLDSYNAGVLRLSTVAGTTTVRSTADAGQGVCAEPALIDTTAETFLQHRELSQEVFGPSTVLVRCGSRDEMEAAAHSLEGQLTATLHATATDLADHAQLVSMLEEKAGRLIVNDFPTGVEVCASMQHGGPYPATTDARTTSVGTAAIHRFARPVAYQNFPQPSLPAALQDANPRRIWRRVDGELTKDPL
jgi:NADP-dependent aldehyde dehydrogenase